MNKPKALHLTGRLLRDARHARRVRRALRARALGLELSDSDRQVLLEGSEMLARALRASRSTVKGSQISSTDQIASFIEDAPDFRLVREAWKGMTALDMEGLEKVRKCVESAYKGEAIEEDLLEEAISLFTRITSGSLYASNEIEMKEVRRSPKGSEMTVVGDDS